MKLFFETAVQKSAFLMSLPVGFMICLILDTKVRSTLIQAVLDLGVLASTGFILVLLVLFSSDASLRIYHLLGFFGGAILYVCGIGKCRKKVKKWYSKRKAGIIILDDEMNTHMMEKG